MARHHRSGQDVLFTWALRPRATVDEEPFRDLRHSWYAIHREGHESIRRSQSATAIAISVAPPSICHRTKTELGASRRHKETANLIERVRRYVFIVDE